MASKLKSRTGKPKDTTGSTPLKKPTRRRGGPRPPFDRLPEIDDDTLQSLVRIMASLSQYGNDFLIPLARALDPQNIDGAVAVLRDQKDASALAALTKHSEDHWRKVCREDAETDEGILVIVDAQRVFSPSQSIGLLIRKAVQMFDVEYGSEDGRGWVPCGLPDPLARKGGGAP